MDSYLIMNNKFRSFSMFVRSVAEDNVSPEIARKIKQYNSENENPLEYKAEGGDLIIAVGGDGTFLNAVTKTQFDKGKVYLGINTGTLGFFQNFSPRNLHYVVNYLIDVKSIKVRKIYIPQVIITMEDGSTYEYRFLNEIIIGAKHYNKVSLEMRVNDRLLQRFTGNGVNIANGATGDTAFSMSMGGPLNFTDYPMLIAALMAPIRNAAYGHDFVNNHILATSIDIVPTKFKENIEIGIDGKVISLPVEKIQRIKVCIDEESYILKFEAEDYLKPDIFRDKIL